jgi:hypothetical protein
MGYRDGLRALSSFSGIILPVKPFFTNSAFVLIFVTIVYFVSINGGREQKACSPYQRDYAEEALCYLLYDSKEKNIFHGVIFSISN